ncbi:MAG: hypothetical protein ACRD2N_14205 [Vicinamibacterales bacterium]
MSNRLLPSGAFRRAPTSLIASLIGLGLVLTLTVTPSVFIVDDLNYLVTVLAARQGHVTVANTEGLTPSRELLFFDPAAHSRVVTRTPVAPVTPPLYGLIAIPFSWLGWRGLVSLNTVAYLATILTVFTYARRYAIHPSTSWIAAAAFALGGYAMEYSQGVWPQALSFCLCTVAIAAAGRVIDGGRVSPAAIAGALLGLATGIRYQNAVLVGVVGGAVALWAPKRFAAMRAFVLGAVVPIGASALINHARLDSWNPISKGPGYLDLPAASVVSNKLVTIATLSWAQIVDYSVRPRLPGTENVWLSYGPLTGAHLMLGVSVKKAFLQSAPWVVLGLVMMVLAWRPAKEMPERQRQLRMMSLVVAATVAVFALAGPNRHEGLAFNARYLLELLPLAAVAFAWSLDGRFTSSRGIGEGLLCGALLVMMILLGTPADGERSALGVARNIALLKIPMLLAGVLAILWWLDGTGYSVRVALMWMAGVALGWGLTLHLLDDVAMAHTVRGWNLSRTVAYEQAVPDHSALVVYWGNKDAVGPLLLSRDIVVLDVHADQGRDAPVLIDELLNSGRRVFLWQDGFPDELLKKTVSGVDATPARDASTPLLELRKTAQ